MEACAEASPVLIMSNINHIIPEIVELGRLNLPIGRLGGILWVGVGPVTDGGGAVVSLFVDCLSPVGHWLDFGLTIS